jgi:ABC-type uncharacterized transport system permease subunit
VSAALPYVAGLRSGMRRALGQPDELAVRLVLYVILLVVFAALWHTAMDGHGGEIAGYDFSSLFWYIAGAEAAVISTKPRMIEEIGDEISSGEVATALLRPVSFVGFRFAVEMGEAAVRLAGTIVICAVVGVLYAGAPPSAAGAALYVPMAFLAIACNLAAQHAFAGSAFWLNDAKSGWFQPAYVLSRDPNPHAVRSACPNCRPPIWI